MVAEANYAFDLNTELFKELDRKAGFTGHGPPKVPAPPLASHVAAAAAAAKAEPSSADGSAAAGEAKKAGGCPFASLAAAGVPMPAHHPPAAAPAVAQSTQAKVEKSKCPIHNIRLTDVAAVLIAIAALILLPSKYSLISQWFQ